MSPEVETPTPSSGFLWVKVLWGNFRVSTADPDSKGSPVALMPRKLSISLRRFACTVDLTWV